MGFKIGNFHFLHGLVLAPMAGVTDRTFRNICKSYGAEYTVSEMVCAKSLCYEQKAKKKDFSVTAELATVLSGDGPMAIQILVASQALWQKRLQCSPMEAIKTVFPQKSLSQ